LTEAYKEYLLNPEITVFVKEYNKREIEVSVLGEVGRPGFYRLPEKSTLLDVIGQVGGLSLRAASASSCCGRRSARAARRTLLLSMPGAVLARRREDP